MLTFADMRLLRIKLQRAAWMARQLELAITRQTKMGPERVGGRSNETPVPFDDAASEAAWVLRNVLVNYAGPVAVARDEFLDLSMQTPDLAMWLHERATSVTDKDVLDELMSALDLGTKAIDRPTVRIYLGDCECGARIYGDPENEAVPCENCSRTHDGRARRRANNIRGRDLPVTANDAARFLGEVDGIAVTAKRIRVWASRGKLVQVGFSPDGQRTYRLGAVVDLAREVSRGQRCTPDETGPA